MGKSGRGFNLPNTKNKLVYFISMKANNCKK